MSKPLPPKLEISCTIPASPSTLSPGAHFGRPPMWSKSAQRQLTRLYVYTTLPLNKILEVIHAGSPQASPGPDSANKKLNTLLDKEPRWLHPRTLSDMARRLEQLAQSSMRLHPDTTPISALHTPGFMSSQHFSTDRASAVHEKSHRPNFVTVEPSTPGSSSNAKGKRPTGGRRRIHGASSTAPLPNEQGNDDKDGHAFRPFLRNPSVGSSLSDETNSSLRKLLSGYSESYVKVVRKLVRRYTGSKSGVSSRMSLSPSSSAVTPAQNWLDDEHAPPGYDARPFPLPGDFLSLDIHMQERSCPSNSLDHTRRRCMCSAVRDICESPWVTAFGLTPVALRLLNGQLNAVDMVLRDAFGNTALHFLAARGNLSQLFQAVQSPLCCHILFNRNSAGQSFLHVVQQSIVWPIEQFCHMLRFLQLQNFDIYTLDHYGRNVFHIMHLADVETSVLQRIVQDWDQRLCSKRDAFAVNPSAPRYQDALEAQRPSTPMDLGASPMSRIDSKASASNPASLRGEKQHLQHVQRAMINPSVQDVEGRNSLHSLARCILSIRTVAEKCNLETRTEQEWQAASHGNPAHHPDSSSDRLAFRLSIMEGLLDAGVDPNHYDYDGNTPLMAFAAQLPEDGDHKLGPATLERLIKAGANVNARNRAGETALHIAARCGRKLAVRALVSNGANVHVRDAAGRSILDVLDLKMMNMREDLPKAYAHYEACRAWLSGKVGQAVQNPSVLDEWKLPLLR